MEQGIQIHLIPLYSGLEGNLPLRTPVVLPGFDFETIEGEEKWKKRGKSQRVKLELCPSVSGRKPQGSLLGLLSLRAPPELWVGGEG